MPSPLPQAASDRVASRSSRLAWLETEVRREGVHTRPRCVTCVTVPRLSACGSTVPSRAVRWEERASEPARRGVFAGVGFRTSSQVPSFILWEYFRVRRANKPNTPPIFVTCCMCMCRTCNLVSLRSLLRRSTVMGPESRDPHGRVHDRRCSQHRVSCFVVCHSITACVLCGSLCVRRDRVALGSAGGFQHVSE